MVLGIPPDFDPRIFVGRTLATVTFGGWVASLAFDSEPRLVVTLEGSYEHAGPAEDGWVDREPRLGATGISSSRLMQLTNHEVISAATEEPNVIRLEFAHGHTLRMIDDSDRYESMQIEHGDRYWVI